MPHLCCLQLASATTQHRTASGQQQAIGQQPSSRAQQPQKGAENTDKRAKTTRAALAAAAAAAKRLSLRSGSQKQHPQPQQWQLPHPGSPVSPCSSPAGHSSLKAQHTSAHAAAAPPSPRSPIAGGVPSAGSSKPGTPTHAQVMVVDWCKSWVWIGDAASCTGDGPLWVFAWSASQLIKPLLASRVRSYSCAAPITCTGSILSRGTAAGSPMPRPSTCGTQPHQQPTAGAATACTWG